MSMWSGVHSLCSRICSTISMDEICPKCNHGDRPLTAEFSTLFRSRWYLSRLFVRNEDSFRFAVVLPPVAILTGSTSWSMSIADSAFFPTEPPSEHLHSHSNGGSLTLQSSIIEENNLSSIINSDLSFIGFLSGQVSGHLAKFL